MSSPIHRPTQGKPASRLLKRRRTDGLHALGLGDEARGVLGADGVGRAGGLDVDEVLGRAVGREEEGVADARDVAAADVVAPPAESADAGALLAAADGQFLDLVEGDEVLEEAPGDGEAGAVEGVAEAEAAVGPEGEEAREGDEDAGDGVGEELRRRDRPVDRPDEERSGEREGSGGGAGADERARRARGALDGQALTFE